MADFEEAAGAVDPGERRRIGERDRRGRAVGRVERIVRQEMQQVRQQQFLVLHLVVTAEFDQRERRRPALHQAGDGVADRGAIARHLGDRRPADQAAAGALVARADLHIVGIEQEAEALVGRRVVRRMGLQHEFLEEPGRMRQMPLDRTRVLHGLGDHVLDREAFGQRLRACARLLEKLRDAFRRLTWFRLHAAPFLAAVRIRAAPKRRRRRRFVPPRPYCVTGSCPGRG